MRSVAEEDIITGGVTITDLADMFGKDPKEVKKILTGNVDPYVTKNGAPRFRVRDAAPMLCEAQMDPEEMANRLAKMPASKWPPVLQDAFWKAQMGRQKYEENKGDLWRTQRVYEVVSGAFKVIRLTILMFVDTVGQRTELTPQQRAILQELGDGLLEMLTTNLREHFAFYVPPEDEHGEPIDKKNASEAIEDDPFA